MLSLEKRGSAEKSYSKFGNMSRLAKKPIIIPEKTTVTVADLTVFVKGPLGELRRNIRPVITLNVGSEGVTMKANSTNKEARALLGTYASHVRNMIKGVNEGFQKKLSIEGIGFKAEVKGGDIVLNIGFSHPVKVPIPAGLKVTVEKNLISISGFDKELVGQFTAKIRSLKKPEPYKGKGIRYEGEVVKIKQGKKTV